MCREKPREQWRLDKRKALAGTASGRARFGGFASCTVLPVTPVPRKGCGQSTRSTYDVLGTDAEGPADDVQDLLHGDGHGSPKLRANGNESGDTLSTGSPTGSPTGPPPWPPASSPGRMTPPSAPSLTHLSRSPRQRARPENLCRSRRRVWASPSSEGASSTSSPGPSHCTGAVQKHRHFAPRHPSSVPVPLSHGR